MHIFRSGNFSILVLLTFFCWPATFFGQASSSTYISEDSNRQLWNTKFLARRPPSTNPASGPSATVASQAGATSEASTDAAVREFMIGFTIWRLRRSESTDDPAVRIIAANGREQWTPVRADGSVPLAEGEKVRVSIEAASSGYLYVVDREQYADGTFGQPYLIFPTLRTNGGDNHVTAGRLIEVPALGDSPPYFTLHASRPDQVAEMLTVLVTTAPLRDVVIERDALRLDPAQVEQWTKQWGAKVERLESRSQVGKPYTRAEKEAGAERTRLLTHEEPLPQTLYRVEAAAGSSLLVDIPLQIRK